MVGAGWDETVYMRGRQRMLVWIGIAAAILSLRALQSDAQPQEFVLVGLLGVLAGLLAVRARVAPDFEAGARTGDQRTGHLLTAVAAVLIVVALVVHVSWVSGS